MAIKLGSTDINSVNLGSVGLNRIYSGSDVVFGSSALQSLYSYRMTTSASLFYPSCLDCDSSKSLSMSLLFRFSDVGIRQNLISTMKSDATDGYTLFYNGSGLLIFQFRNSTSLRNQTNWSFTPVVDTWYTIVFTAVNLDGLTWNIRVNDVELTPTFTLQQHSGTVLTNRDVEIGRFRGIQDYFEGDFNHAIVYNDLLLDSSDMTDIYNSGQPKLDFAKAKQAFRARFDDDTWDSGNSQFTSINDFGNDGYSINIIEADKVLSSPY
jgi:hypothetical protein